VLQPVGRLDQLSPARKGAVAVPTRIHLTNGQSIVVAEDIPQLDRASEILRATTLPTAERIAILRTDVDALEWEPR
jgi:hypothetical protein